MTRDIKSLCCLTKPNKPTIFLHFFINAAKGSVLFRLTMALICKVFVYGSSTFFMAWKERFLLIRISQPELCSFSSKKVVRKAAKADRKLF